MDFTLSEEQHELSRAVAAFLEKRSPEPEVRRLMEAGFTWEHPAQLYYKRAKSSEVMFGDPATQRERLAVLVGI